MSITSDVSNDARWVHTVSGLEIGEHYYVSGYIKGQDVTRYEGDAGATLCLMYGFTRSQQLDGTFDWTKVGFEFRADSTSVDVACRLGFYGSEATGKIWCDGLSIRKKTQSWSTTLPTGNTIWRVITQQNGVEATFAEKMSLKVQ